MLLIGSRALNQFLDIGRNPMDVDYITTFPKFFLVMDDLKNRGLIKAMGRASKNTIVIKLHEGGHGLPLIQEYVIAEPGSSDEMLLDYCRVNETDAPSLVAPLNVLYMLKMSHRYKKDSPHFKKTMDDIRRMRKAGANLDCPNLNRILIQREKETYTNALPKLNQAKGDFFKKEDAFYVWDHDDIHDAVATLHKPAYTFFKPENSQVMCSKKMWDACDLDIQLRAGLEESYVLAIERSLVPAPGVLTPKQAFTIALTKVCSSITSGWFREFCWEHYEEIMTMYDESFVAKFEAARDAGKIRPYAGHSMELAG